jgi:predicted dehydrogenase
MNNIINVGIIGCGEATQLLHLPTLRELTDHCRVGALCDLSETVLRSLGSSLPEAKPYNDAETLIADPNVEAVPITTPHPLAQLKDAAVSQR